MSIGGPWKGWAVAAWILIAGTRLAWGAGIPWENDVDQALAKAALGQRLVLVHFWDDGCPPCARMETHVFRDPDVARYLSLHFIPVKIKVSAQPAVRQRFNVRAWPTDVILDPRGNELYRGVPRPDPRHFIATLSNVAAHARIRQPVRRKDPGSNWQDPRQAARQGFAAAGRQVNGTAQPVQRNSAFQPPVGVGPGPGAPTATPAQRPAPGIVQNQFVVPPAAATPQPTTGGPLGKLAAAAPAYGTRVGGATSPPPPSHAAPSSHTKPHDGDSVRTVADEQPSRPTSNPANIPNLGLDGYCPVTLATREMWRRGDPRFGARHRGKTYLFVDAEAQKVFLSDPDRYAPMLSGLDVVRLIDHRQYVEGKRASGFFYRKRIYLFADQESIAAFLKRPDFYHLQAMAMLRRAQDAQRSHRNKNAAPAVK